MTEKEIKKYLSTNKLLCFLIEIIILICGGLLMDYGIENDDVFTIIGALIIFGGSFMNVWLLIITSLFMKAITFNKPQDISQNVVEVANRIDELEQMLMLNEKLDNIQKQVVNKQEKKL